MTANRQFGTISIVGGTGALGGGLARRWIKAGLPVVIGSRNADKAATAAAELRSMFPDADVQGLGNLEAARAGAIVVLTVPYPSTPHPDGDPAGTGWQDPVDTTVPLMPPRVARVQLPKRALLR
ncbi:MAG: NAD(P)-binding domain-containing protein [Gammaproteobacteria bacterium]